MFEIECLRIAFSSQSENGFWLTVLEARNNKEFIMSGVNGDKSRFNRLRKQKLARRIRNRELFEKASQPKPPAASASHKRPANA